jgi:hypothetical protein
MYCKFESDKPITLRKFGEFTSKYLGSEYGVDVDLIYQGSPLVDKNMIIDDSVLKKPLFDLVRHFSAQKLR